MINRRKFIENLSAAGVLSLIPGALRAHQVKTYTSREAKSLPVVISTWIHGIDANAKAIEVLKEGVV